jgi:acetoin utilization deacetylase AcuC-like enzyme
VDILENDRLGKLSITKAGVRERDIIVFEKAHRHQIPLMTSMGGGYARHIRNIVDAHCNTYRIAKEIYD